MQHRNLRKLENIAEYEIHVGIMYFSIYTHHARAAISFLNLEGGIERECHKCIILDLQIVLCQRQKRRPSIAIDVR
jgi:hypothetical protein